MTQNDTNQHRPRDEYRDARTEPGAQKTKISRPGRASDNAPRGASSQRTRTPDVNRRPRTSLPPEITESQKYKRSHREFRKFVKGRPSRSMSVVSVPAALWSGVKKALFTILVLFLVALAFIGGTGLGMLSGYISTAQPLEIVDIKQTYEATHIYDRYGNEAAVLTGSQNVLREYIPLSEIKDTYLEDAFIAIEDERFETHNGIDPRRITSAVGNFFIQGGGSTHGASTITQQVVKMMSGDDERSAQRKIQEWERAVALEKQLSKDEIMELFINMVPMGGAYVGVQSASKAYFGKDASELDLAESAFLAGIPNLPAIYNPRTEYGKRNALRRMRIILGKMLELGKITERQYEEAINRELVFASTESTRSSGKIHSYFIDAVVNDVMDALVKYRGYSRQLANIAVFQHGLRIETTLDPHIQALAEESFHKKDLFSANYDKLPDSPQVPQAAITIMANGPENIGQVVAIVGGYGDKQINFGFNRATMSYRQPGSSIKPILVYAPAIDMGIITPATVMMDEPKHLDPHNPDADWPQNANRNYRGAVTMRTALRLSLNTIPVEIYATMLTPQIGLSYLQQMGIDRMNEPQPAGAIGGFMHGMSTIEMAGAFSTLANRGIFTEPYLFTRVLDAEGNVLLEHKPEFMQVFSVETADIVNNMLDDTLKNAPWIRPYSSIGKQPAAGKTGTSDKGVDRWFCGYTPYYTAAVWYGYDNAHGRHQKIPSADRPCPIRIWADVMTNIHKDLDVKSFEMSNNVKRITVCSESGMLPGPYCETTVSDYFNSTQPQTYPNHRCPIHVEPPEETDIIEPPDDTPEETDDGDVIVQP